MLGLPIETAVLAALIGLVSALVGQVVGAVIGSRYAANLNRKTQLELADLAFQRQWREKLVRPFLDLADERMIMITEFSHAASNGNSEQTQEDRSRTPCPNSTPPGYSSCYLRCEHASVDPSSCRRPA